MKSDTGGNIRLEPIHLSWIDHIFWCRDNKKFPFIVAPRGHGKSSLMAVALPLWIIGRDQNRRIMILCNTDDNAKKRVRAIKDYIENDPMYQRVFPDLVPDKRKPWTSNMLYVKTDRKLVDPSICAFGVESSGTGSRATDQICDDVVDEDNAIRQPCKKPAIVSSYTTKWLPCVTEPVFELGQIYGIGTRWAHADLTDYLCNSVDFAPLIQ